MLKESFLVIALEFNQDENPIIYEVLEDFAFTVKNALFSTPVFVTFGRLLVELYFYDMSRFLPC